MVPPGAPGPPGGPKIDGPITWLSTPSGQIVRHDVHQKVGCKDTYFITTLVRYRTYSHRLSFLFPCSPELT